MIYRLIDTRRREKYLNEIAVAMVTANCRSNRVARRQSVSEPGAGSRGRLVCRLVEKKISERQIDQQTGKDEYIKQLFF